MDAFRIFQRHILDQYALAGINLAEYSCDTNAIAQKTFKAIQPEE
jgi:hypothetical protein